MDSRPPSSASPLSMLECFEVGIIQLDAERRVVGMNQYARRVLPVEEKQPFERMVLSFDTERSQPRVGFLLDQAAQCPVNDPPPMTLIIGIPERVLLIQASRLSGYDDQTTGFTLIFHDITELVSGDDSTMGRPDQHRPLLKIPTVAGQKIVLVDVDQVRAIRTDGHCVRVLTAAGSHFCNLAISDLETRLDPARFMRVHRSHIVNLHAVSALQRDEGRLSLRLADVEGAVPVSRSSTAGLLQRLGVPGGGGPPARQG